MAEQPQPSGALGALAPARSTDALRRQILVALAVFFGLIVALAIFEIRHIEQRAIQEAQDRASAQAHVFAEFALATIKRLDDFALDARSRWDGDSRAFSDFVRSRQSISDIAFQAGVIGPDGILEFSNLAKPDDRIDLSDREHFRIHADNPDTDRLFISKPLKGKVSGKWSIQFTRPIYDDGKFAGVFVASVSPSLFSDFAVKLALPPGSVTWAVRDGGALMARHPEPEGAIGLVATGRPYLEPGAPVSGSYRALGTVDGLDRVYGFHRLPQYGLSFAVGHSVAEIREKLGHEFRVIVAAVTLVGILLALFYLALSRSLARLAQTQDALARARRRARRARPGRIGQPREEHLPRQHEP
ncbi:MAG: hypothetical protein FIB06_09770 [Betaproteobacteria bacterium]|nr:hypothetical protein [Betaproteobacteria bacterium]